MSNDKQNAATTVLGCDRLVWGCLQITMKNRQLIDGVLSHMGRQISSDERSAVADVLRAGENHGYGNMIAWLATAWAASHRAQGIDAKPEDFAGGRGYPLPPTIAPNTESNQR